MLSHATPLPLTPLPPSNPFSHAQPKQAASVFAAASDATAAAVASAASLPLPETLAPPTPPLAFHFAPFERQSWLMREQLERFFDGGDEPLMPGWVDLPGGIGLIDTLPERLETGVHYLGPPIDFDM